jgi:hypothetical protein
MAYYNLISQPVSQHSGSESISIARTTLSICTIDMQRKMITNSKIDLHGEQEGVLFIDKRYTIPGTMFLFDVLHINIKIKTNKLT